MNFNFTLPGPITFIFTMAWLGLFMYIGVLLRAKVSFLRRYLIPTCITGGVIGMLSNWLFLGRLGPLGVSPDIIKAVSFHIFPLFFSALAFRTPTASKSGRGIFIGGLWLAASFLTFAALLYVVSCLITMGTNIVCGTDYMASFGIIPTNGFINGPGTAMPLGLTWDNHLQNGIELATLGMSGGSIGFLLAYIIGIPLANYYHKRSRLLSNCDLAGEAEHRGYYASDDECAEEIGRETTHNSNIETLALHIGIVFFNYGLALALCLGMAQLLSYSSFKNYTGMVWTFVWMAPIITAWPLRKMLVKTGFYCLIDQKIMSHLGNFFIDLMVMCSFFGMALTALKYYLPLLCAISILIPLVLYVLTRITVKYVNNYKDIRTLYIMGTLTGTAATGLFLCRIIDPENKSPIAYEQAIAPMFVSMGEIPTAPLMHLEVLGGHSPWILMGALLVKAVAAGVALMIITRLLNKAYLDTAPKLIER